jgi:hypothetical protein
MGRRWLAGRAIRARRVQEASTVVIHARDVAAVPDPASGGAGPRIIRDVAPPPHPGLVVGGIEPPDGGGLWSGLGL